MIIIVRSMSHSHAGATFVDPYEVMIIIVQCVRAYVRSTSLMHIAEHERRACLKSKHSLDPGNAT